MKYRDNMPADELNALLAECQQLQDCYADAAATEVPPEDEECECFDPIRDGWVGKDGRP
jgi:hypothetical protein